MVEKKEGKENEKCSTMPDVLIKGYKILRTVRVGQDFWVNTKGSLFVKLSGMRKKEGIREEGKRLEKERGKEDKKYRVNTKGCGIG